jgi:NNP family nitrate/nitrite transporter-like MFS transporter
MTASTQDPPRNRTWLERWNPEDAHTWDSSLAWRTLWITTFNLLLAFGTWFMVSVIAVRLPNIGFGFSSAELFWITAMPGLAAGTLRLVHMFLTPIFGTRRVVSVSTLLLLIPAIGWGLAISNPGTPYAMFLLLAFMAGLGGGNFSSFMPSTSLFFPKKLQGTALGLQAGVGNFGVSVAQFVTPWIIGFAAFGSLVGGPETFTKGEVTKNIWLQNAAFWYVPLIVIGAIVAWMYLKSVPVRANVREQMDIFRDKHTWVMTGVYMMTFGSFSGLSAAFPLLIREVYGKLDGAPDPLAYAFLGPLVGSLVRVIFGRIADRTGGAILTHLAGIGMVASAIAVTFFTQPSSVASFPYFLAAMLALFFFAGIGNASTFKQMPMIFPPRQAGGVIGFTAAIAAYGPFLVSILVSAALASSGSPNAFFYGAAVFYALNVGLNWWLYTRKGAEKPC